VVSQPGGAERSEEEIPLLFVLTRDGRVYFRNTRFEAKSLPILIHGAVGDGAEKKVYLAVDARAR